MQKQKALLRERLGSVLLFFLLLYIFYRIPTVMQGVRGALSVCASALIPSVFPFLVVTDWVLHTKTGMGLLSALAAPLGRLFHTSREGTVAYLVGLLFGFPLGIKTVATLYREGRIDKAEAERLLLFCNNTGPAFLIGSVGIGMLGSARDGLALYLAEVAVSLAFGICVGLPHRKRRGCPLPAVSDEPFALSSSITAATRQMLSVCGCVLFFSALSALLAPLLPVAAARSLLYALLEVGSATSLIAAELPVSVALPLCGFAVGFSGLSVWLQGKTLLHDTGLSARLYLPAKLLQGALCFLFLFLLPLH